jgi:hypothetical protein
MEMCHFFNGLQYMLDESKPDEDNLMTICQVISGLSYKAAGYKDYLEKTSDLATLAVYIFEICLCTD